MEAGQGAEEQASRRARKLARLQREHAAGAVTDEQVQRQIAQAQRQQRAWSAGAEGERLVATAIGTLAQYGWVGLHDVRWPDRPLANIDHIAIGPGGIVVVDAKNWSGEVVVCDGLLRQNGYRRDDQLDGIAQATAAVTALLLPQHRSATAGVLCLASQEDMPPTATASGVAVVGRHALPGLLVGRPARLTPYEVADIARYLADALDHAAGRHGAPGARPRPTTTRRRAPRPAPQARSGSGRRPTARSLERRRGAARRAAVDAVVRLGVVGAGLLGLLWWVQNLAATTGP